MYPEKDALYWQLNDELAALYRRNFWFWRHFFMGTLKRQVERARLHQSRRAEEQIADFIRDEFCYQAYLTTHNCPFDLYVSDGRQAARVEVKLSTYHAAPWSRAGRYQADVRQLQQIDLIVWICRTPAPSSRDYHYVIPASDLRGRRNLAIWSRDPTWYRGQWSQYLNAWRHLAAAVANTAPRVWQFSLTVPAVAGGRVC